MKADQELSPLRGAQLTINESILHWVRDTLDSICLAYGEAGGDDQLDENKKVLLRKMKDFLGEDFEVVSDSFGVKVFTTRPYPANTNGGELRIGIVLTKRGNFALDIRPWGDY